MSDKNETTILIVDDNECIRELLKEFLKTHEYRVKTAKNGFDALEKIRKECFQVVICDINMPECSGLEVLKKALLINSATKFIMMTANGNEYYYTQSMSGGASDFISKPFDISQILSAIERSLGSQSSYD